MRQKTTQDDLRDFNSRAHVERDQYSTGGRSKVLHFNSRAHVERDLEAGIFNADTKISTHALTWSATGISVYSSAATFDFNSRAHVERDLQLAHWCCNRQISTHALTWSATQTAYLIGI